MKIRHMILLSALLLPQVALADDLSSQSQAPQTAVGASDLLPQTGDGNGVSSTGAGTTLQPGATSLQGSAADGSSLSAPSDQALQAAPLSDDLKVMLGGEADGAPQTLDDSTSQLGEDLIALAIGIIVVCGTIAWLRRRVLATNIVV